MTSVLLPFSLEAVSLMSALTVMLQEQHQTGGDVGARLSAVLGWMHQLGMVPARNA